MKPQSRSRLPIAAAAAAVLVGITVAVLQGLRGGPARPDIVLVVWDTCRGDRVSVNGYPFPTTPRLAELAARGVVFRNCFTPSPWTPPAHASLFTGLLPRRHGLREGEGDRVRSGIPLLAQTLSAAGYETVAVVANPHLSRTSGLLDGFEQVVECWSEDGRPGTGSDARVAVEAFAAARAEKGGRKPCFLFVNIMDTHLPYRFEDAAAAAVHGDGAVNGARRAAGEVTVEAANRHLHGVERIDGETIRALGDAYDAAVRLADRSTGRMLDALGRTGMLGSAVVVVVGDHGENLGEHGELSHLTSVYDPVLHVPLVVAWPGRFEGGRVEDAQVRLQDLYPTLLEAAGAAVPRGCGTDAVSLLEAPLRPRPLLSEYGPAEGFLRQVLDPAGGITLEVLDRCRLRYRALREPAGAPGARKLVTVTRPSAGGEARLEREELYDPAADPGESRNLLAPPVRPEEAGAADRLRALDR